MDNYLKNIRLTLGYNQQEMADKLSTNINTYRGYEYNKRDLPDDFVFELANRLNVNLHFLYTGKGSMFINENTKDFDICDDDTVLKQFKKFGERYTNMLAEIGLDDYRVSKLTGIPESTLEKIGLGLRDISMNEFLKMRSKIKFDTNEMLLGLSLEKSTKPENELSAEELAVLKKLAQKIK